MADAAADAMTVEASPSPHDLGDDEPSQQPPRRDRAPTINVHPVVDTCPDMSQPNPSFPEPDNDLLSHHPSASISSSQNFAGSTIAPDSSPVSQAASPQSRYGVQGPGRPDLSAAAAIPGTVRPDRAPTFLSVPSNIHRSRQNSIDSDDASRTVGSASHHEPQHDSSVDLIGRGRRSRSPSSVASKKAIDDPDALTPARPEDALFFNVDKNPFAFSPGQLGKMFEPKSLSAFWALGGLRGLERGLRTDHKAGLNLDETSMCGSVSFDEATLSDPESLSATTQSHLDSSPDSTSPDGDLKDPGHPSSIRSVPMPPSSDKAFADRRRVFGDNRVPEKKGKTLLQLMWITYNDRVLILLSAAAAVSLAVGLYQTFAANRADGQPRVEWVEGVAIVAAIVIVVFVGSLNDYQKERQFARLNRKKLDRKVNVTRSGRMAELSVFDVLVGDVLHLEPGALAPVDGVFIDGFNLRCDESQATGESDIILKLPADRVYAAIQADQSLRHLDPFILSGSRVMEGVGTYIATCTGIHSTYGKTIMSVDQDPEITPLQSKLNIVAEYIAKLGGAAALLLFAVLFIEFLVRLPSLGPQVTPAAKGQQFIQILIVIITIIVVAVPEGLPLAVTLALAFATTRMLKDNNLVRHLKACEVMGNATTICSDKTGTLTENKMQVVAATIGVSASFGGVSVDRPPTPARLSSSSASAAAAPTFDDSAPNPTATDERSTPPACSAAAPNHASSPAQFVAALCPEVKTLLRASIALNSTAFEGEIDNQKTFIGSKTETALLIFSKDHLGMGPVAEERESANVVHMFPFDSRRKCMAVAVQLSSGKARLYIKGASEIVLARCGYVLANPTVDDSVIPFQEEGQARVRELIQSYGSRSLRTLVLAHKDFETWPPRSMRRRQHESTYGQPLRGDKEKGEMDIDDVSYGMTFTGIVGIQDPLRKGVLEAVKQCQRAGVVVRMVTGDNQVTARAIAQECGILQESSIVLEGPEFRRMSRQQQLQIVPKLHLMARSSPDDKRTLVECLKSLGETVAVTGDGTNDAPALKTADIGFSMGLAGTEVAKEASDIILMDDNFASVVMALKWGRAVNDAVKRFLQFQLTVNITAVVLTFVTAVASAEESSVLTAVQLLWVNLIMDTLAALALATDPPLDSSLNRKPERRGASIISITMWKMIIGQSIYQLAITLTLYYGLGSTVAKLNGGYVSDDQVKTLVFNTFVWMQIFNQWNNRRLDNEFNIFEGLSRNWFFIGVNVLMCGGQVLIILVGGTVFQIAAEGQSGALWAIALVLGVISVFVGMMIRLIPDRFVAALIPTWPKIGRGGRGRRAPGLTVTDEEQPEFFPSPLMEVRDELAFLKRIKGGRLNNLRFAMRQTRETILARSRSPSFYSHSRSGSSQPGPSTPKPDRDDSFGGMATPDGRQGSWSVRSRSNSALGAPTVMAGLVAAGVAAGWNPNRMVPREATATTTAESTEPAGHEVAA